MKKVDERMLLQLTKIEYGFYRDTYLCGIAMNNKNEFMYSVRDKVKKWVERNGGKFTVLSGEVRMRNIHKKGFVVQITFPCHAKKDMKNIMATIW